jgi:phosphatidylglycerophosphate synthase
MAPQPFAGASKASRSLLSPVERRMAAYVVPRIPRWLETYHLTLLTLVWCGGIALFGYFAAADLRWLWASSAMVVLHYFTDFFDGKVGKYRNTGLVTWGFYLDHVFDYVFLCALAIGYAFLLPQSSHLHLLLILAVYGGFMVNSFLAFSATDQFEISHAWLGPTEFRIAIVVINALVVESGTRRMEAALPWVAAGALVMLIVLVYRTQRHLWRQDMARKASEAC